jgi:eukaryotic-like serine/threonine-protein kinase
VSLAAGTRLGPYEILSPIGAGGMGEVYRARDARLERDVAIKVLPALLSADADRTRRFEQEAKAAGALNHPNITAVYDVGQHDGAPYVVQELLEGETLRAELAGSRLSPRRAVHYAIEIARGLAAAHEKGIVHRDLKPENLFVTTDGRVKILDFGLAKLIEPAGTGDQTGLPTATRGTEPGVVLGTLGYMSPEQVRGKPADHRSDIFSFGAILYEMLSGRKAFQGDSAADTMTAILREDPPDLSVTNQSISPALDRVVRHCLEKTPERRLHSAHDLAFELEALSQSSVAATVAAHRRPRLGRFAVIALALAAIVASFFLGRTRATSASRSVQTGGRAFEQLTSFPGAELSPALSPDGQTLAFSRRVKNSSHVFTMRTGGENATDLTPDCDKDSGTPAFSPDGKVIAYSTTCNGGGIMLVGATGESARRLTSLGESPAWSPDGKEIVYDTESNWTPYGRAGTSELWIVDASSGKTRKVFAGDAVQPSVSPHGWRIAYWGLPATTSQRDIWTIPYGGLAGGEKPVPVTNDAPIDWNPVWSSDGRSLFFLSTRDGSMNLWRVPIDEKSGRTLGPPEPRTLPATMVAGFAISADGRHLAFGASNWEYSVERLAMDLTTGTARGSPVEVFRTSRSLSYVAPSPDGSQIAIDSQGSLHEDIVVAQADGSHQRRLMDDEPRDRGPSFFPDGKRIAFQSDREGGSWDIWTIATDGSGLRRLTKGENVYTPIVSPDGRHITATDGTAVHLYDLDEAGTTVTASRKLPLPPGAFAATATDWTRDGKGLLTAAVNKDYAFDRAMVYRIDRDAWEPLPAFPAATTGLIAFAGPRRIVATSQEGILIADLPDGKPRLLVPHPADGPYVTCVVNAEGTEGLLTHYRQNVDLWMSTPP